MNIEQMEQNAALELFRYLKEHLIPLAKNKNDKIFESDVTIQITRSINKDIWNCEEEVKQLLSKTESRSVMISCIIDHVIINYSQNAQSLYIGFFIADKIAYEYGIEYKLDTFIKSEKRIRGFSFSKEGILYGHSTPRIKPKEFKSSLSMNFVAKGTKHWPCTMKDLFSVHTYSGLFESVVYFIMLFFGETNPLWNDLAKDYTEQSAYSAIPLSVINESHSRRELIAKYYGEDKAFKRNNKEPIGYNLIYGLGLLLTVLTFTLTLLIDNFFLLLEAASIITGYVAAGACVVASIACFNMAISNDKKNKLESADIEYDQNCLVFYTSKDERYVLTEIKTIYAKGEKYHIDGKAAKYTTQLGKSHTVHLDIIPATYQNCIYLCDILNNITQGTNQNK